MIGCAVSAAEKFSCEVAFHAIREYGDNLRLRTERFRCLDRGAVIQA
jgi:hypothetical protein